MKPDVLVIAPFRRPTFRKAISPNYPICEPWDSAPLTAAGGLRQAGMEVRYLGLQNIFDGWQPDSDMDKLRNILGSHIPDIVVFSSDDYIPSRSTATLYGMRIVTSLVKSINPRAKVIASGRLATVRSGRMFEDVPGLDHIFVGEWKEDAGTTLARLGKGNSIPAICSIGIPDTNHSLDSAPIPAWDLLPESMNWYQKIHVGCDVNTNLSLRTSAGCKFRCRFCAGVPYWNNYRVKSPTRVDRELRLIKDSLGNKGRVCFLEDELFTRDPDHVASMASVFRTHGILLDGLYTHSSLLTDRVLADICDISRAVYLGLDNSNDGVLRSMRKGQTLSTVLNSIERATNAGVAVHLEWIVGAPEDTVETVLENINAMYVLLSTGMVEGINTYVFCPHPGTDYAERPQQCELQITGELDEMLENGGFPTGRTRGLSRQQVFVAYLITQLMSQEVVSARAHGYHFGSLTKPNLGELRTLLSHFAGKEN